MSYRPSLASTLAATLLLMASVAAPCVAGNDADPPVEKKIETGKAETGKTDADKARPEQYPKDGKVPAALPPESGVTTNLVPTVLRAPSAKYEIAPKSRAFRNIKAMDPPRPKNRSEKGTGYRTAEPMDFDNLTVETPTPLTPDLTTSFESTNFVTNPNLTGGRLFIPPDPVGAAGSAHVVSVTNVVVHFLQKDGTSDFQASLQSFFNVVAPLTFTFDPRVIYDQYADRFVVMTAEQTDIANGAPANTSRLFVAVSDDGDPNGSWTVAQINLVQDIGGDTWADFPMVGLDDKAIYVTTNQFFFFDNPSGAQYRGVRLFILDKGLGKGGFYDDGFLSVNVFNPYLGGGIVATSAPAHVFGTPQGATGTQLFSYEGLSDGTTEFVQTIRVDDPLGSPVFTQQFITVGDIENFAGSFPNAPQSGTSETVETNNRRGLRAVWRDNRLWGVATIDPLPGDPDAGQATAHWFELDTTNLNSLTLASHGNIGGEDIAEDTHTFFPSVAVNDAGQAAFSFAASAATIFPGAYYATLNADGSIGTSRALREGTDFYVRKFGGSLNRWGDYSSMSVDPADQCFWVYNQYAAVRGNPTGSGDDGQWATAFGKFCATNCGDGIVDPGEECDDGNLIDDDDCNNNCEETFCGDGARNRDEECDDGNDDDFDLCRNSCLLAKCDDGIIDTLLGETCEPAGAPAGANGNLCRDQTCTVCGDAVWQFDDGEECDDGNTDDGDLCNNSCVINECFPGDIVLMFDESRTAIFWASAGDPFWYDMLSGSLSELLADNNITRAFCFSNNLQTPDANDFRAAPASGEAYYYLVRPQALCGQGDYGTDTSGLERVPWPGDCQ